MRQLVARFLLMAVVAAMLLCGCSASQPGATHKNKACDCPKFNTKRFGEPKKHY